MKRKIISFASALAAAVVLLTGCNSGETSYYPYAVSNATTVNDESRVSEDAANIIASTVTDNTTNSIASSTTTSIVPDEPAESTANTPAPIATPSYSSSTTSSAPVQAPSQTAYRTATIDIKSEEFVEYTTGNAELSSGANTPYLFNFKTRMAVGYSLNDLNNQLPVEADYGIMGEFNGSTISYKTYNNTNKTIIPISGRIDALDETLDKSINETIDENTRSMGFAGMPNGLYRLVVKFSNQTTANLYFLINGDEYMFCQMIMANTFNTDKHHNINTIRRRRADIHRLLNEWDITPENSLSVSVIKYPTKEKYKDGKLVWRCDTGRWAAISDEICDPNWSDERKAYVICDWMSQNLAYSRYVSRVIHTDVAFYHDDYTGKYSVYDLRAGVCRDFGQILTIMFRQQGIPAEVMANDEHLWNIAYLNGTWIEIDICCSVSKVVEGADATVRIPKTDADYLGLLSMSGQMNHTDEYATSLHRFLYVGQSVF